VRQFTHPFRAVDSAPVAAMMPPRPASTTAQEDGVRNPRGFTLVELLIVVAIIAIIAAVAIPALLRSRVSANEAATVGDVRAVLSAQAAYHSVNGGLYDGDLACLTRPHGCIPSYPSTAPTFLDSNMAALNPKSGYARSFGGWAPGSVSPTVSPSSVTAYKYDALPIVNGQTGIRAFAGDHSGRVCYTPDGTVVPAAPGGGMDRSCDGIQ
jgi:prepilin-type N-terminal cleavage/methylation domain-containing protein